VQRELLDHVVEICQRYRGTACIDQYASAQVEHHLAVHGVSVLKLPMSAQSKTAAYVEVRQRLYTGELDIPNDPELLGDLRRLRTKIAPGSSSVIVPRVSGNHGDRGSALAIACLAQAQTGMVGGAHTDVPVAGGVPISQGIAEALDGRPRRVDSSRPYSPGSVDPDTGVRHAGISVRDVQF
jgi:hypothetical protein